jgi:hypothetical protein
MEILGVILLGFALYFFYEGFMALLNPVRLTEQSLLISVEGFA